MEIKGKYNFKVNSYTESLKGNPACEYIIKCPSYKNNCKKISCIKCTRDLKTNTIINNKEDFNVWREYIKTVTGE